MKKFIFLAGVAIGFVIGSSMGRGPYESLERTARQVADDPEVKRRAAQAKDAAGKAAHEAADTVKAKAPEVAATVQEAVGSAAAGAKQRLAGGETEGADGAQGVDKSEDLTAAADGVAASESAAGGDAEVSEGGPLSS